MRHTLASIVIEEFGALIQKPYFNRSDHTNSIDDINFSEAFQIIEETAPEWHAFLKQLLNNTRAHRSSYATSTDTEEAISKRIFTITSIVCHSRARQQSNYLASTLAAYMMGSGTKRRVLEVLAGLGICHGYRQTRRLTNEVAQESVVCNPLSSDRDS
jgi:hypothetical protein